MVRLAPGVRLELTTLRLTAACSAIELLRNSVASFGDKWYYIQEHPPCQGFFVQILCLFSLQQKLLCDLRLGPDTEIVYYSSAKHPPLPSSTNKKAPPGTQKDPLSGSSLQIISAHLDRVRHSGVFLRLVADQFAVCLSILFDDLEFCLVFIDFFVVSEESVELYQFFHGISVGWA